MIDFLYTLFIAPLEYWMHEALLWGHAQTLNWGWAIIVMSLVVNIVILPIYMKAEAWQEDERALRKSFEDKEAMIKASFKGQERFAMITTMHRQAGFSPLLSLRSSIGFFLQIPFFFAAYHFLSHFEPLQGVSFWFLHDLSKPDALFSLGGFDINVMPILMTVINVASALVYTKNLARRDKMQLYGMAALFLVLLYTAASGLVLYWTCNNIFSLGKNIVYDLVGRIDFKRLPRLSPEARFFTAQATRSLTWRDTYLLGIWAIGSFFALISSNQMMAMSDAQKFTFSNLSDYLYVFLAVVLIVEAVRARVWKRPMLCLWLTVIVYYELSVWIKWYFLGENRHYFALTAGLLLFVAVLMVMDLKGKLSEVLYPSVKPASLATPAGVWLVVLLAFYLPVQAYCTAPETFSRIEEVLALLILYTAIGAVVMWAVLKLFILCRRENLGGYALAFIAILMTVYAFLLPLQVGTIDAFIIANPQPLFRSVNLLVDAAVIATVTVLFIVLIRKNQIKLMRMVLCLCTIAGLGNAVVLLWNSQAAWKLDPESAQSVQLPAYNDRLFGFSRNGHNIVVVMLDAFAGSHVKAIMDENPELHKQFAGFTWYRDTLATGPSTAASLPSILCGEQCTPWELNKNEDLSLVEKINRGYADTINRLPEDFDIAIFEKNWLDRNRLMQHTSRQALLIRNIGDSYTRRYQDKNNIEIEAGNSDSFLLAVSLFNAVPWSMKNVIYKDGRWIERVMGKSDVSLAYKTFRDLALIESLPEVSNTHASGNTFKFIDSELSHYPWFLLPDTCQVNNKPVGGSREDKIPGGQFATEVCSLKSVAKWFDWMRQEGIFDNTTIIVVSDHSSGFVPEIDQAFNGNPPDLGRPSALMLIKHRNADPRAPMAVSNIQIGNVHTLNFVLAAVKNERYNESHDVRHTFVPDGVTGNLYREESFWRVKGPMYQADSWEQLSGK